MPKITIVFGVLLIALGLFGYFASEGRSVTALIPAFVGAPLLICGLLALKEGAVRMHAMHVAAALALLGALAAAGRGAPRIGVLFGDAPFSEKQPILLVMTMAAICLVYVGLAVRSFINARRERQAGQKTTA